MKRAGLRCGKMELGHLVPFKDFAQSNKQPLKDLKQRRDMGNALACKDGCGCPVEKELEKR